MEFRKASLDDLDNLVSLEAKCFITPWNKEGFEYEIKENQFSRTIVVYDEDTFVGYIVYWILFDQGQINKICVKEEYRQKGIASKLMDKALEDFQTNECFMLSLEVRVSNEKAIKLYEKFGFTIALTKKQYYTDGEDAYFMVKGV